MDEKESMHKRNWTSYYSLVKATAEMENRKILEEFHFLKLYDIALMIVYVWSFELYQGK